LLSDPTFFKAEPADAALYNKTPFPNPVTQNIQSYPAGFATCVKPLEQCDNGAYAPVSSDYPSSKRRPTSSAPAETPMGYFQVISCHLFSAFCQYYSQKIDYSYTVWLDWVIYAACPPSSPERKGGDLTHLPRTEITAARSCIDSPIVHPSTLYIIRTVPHETRLFSLFSPPSLGISNG
jgi:hypothetical protein